MNMIVKRRITMAINYVFETSGRYHASYMKHEIGLFSPFLP